MRKASTPTGTRNNSAARVCPRAGEVCDISRNAAAPLEQLALVAVEGAAFHFDKPFSYRVPAQLAEKALPGARVVVPFGSGDRGRQGIILALETDGAEKKKLKPLLEVTDKNPLISSELLSLAVWMKEHFYCTLFDALKQMLPAGLSIRLTKTYTLSPSFDRENVLLLDGDEERAVEYLRRRRTPAERGRLLKALGLAESSRLPETLVLRGILCEAGALEEKNAQATVTMLRLAVQDTAEPEAPAQRKLTPAQKRVMDVLEQFGSASMKETCYYAGVTPAVIKLLLKKGAVEQYEKRVFRNPYRKAAPEAETPVLSARQQEAFETLRAQYERHTASAALLYGVTGSGKTLVFMSLIETVLAEGRGVIVLVPEISLTPQAVARFTSRFGDKVAVLHSGLSIGERMDEWERVRSGAARVVVGTRSAVFAPVAGLGLIIMDEEQEHTYKSESSPRYHARDIARYRCAKSHAMLLLASATPGVESFYAAQRGRYSLVRLDERYGDAVLPEVAVVDMKRELANGNLSPVSERLLRELRLNIKRGEQSILLLNRRGYHTYIYCGDCGETLTCPHCSISLNYHAANGRLMCHYCGYSTTVKTTCPKCGSTHLKYSGTGTQKLEETLSELLPGVRLLRMDTDTTMAKYSHEKILNRFEKEGCDILIGTQMVAKGLDYPNVTLVGVLSVDQMLYMNDFRATERTFSLLTQVIGRAGRGGLRGRAVIQTQTPEHRVLCLAARQDYDAFFREEIGLRKLLLYPPYCSLCEICFSGPTQQAAEGGAQAFYRLLAQAASGKKDMPLRILGPAPAGVMKAGGRYRYRILLKCRDAKPFREMMAQLLRDYGRLKCAKTAAAYIDMNPLSII